MNGESQDVIELNNKTKTINSLLARLVDDINNNRNIIKGINGFFLTGVPYKPKEQEVTTLSATVGWFDVTTKTLQDITILNTEIKGELEKFGLLYYDNVD